MSGGGFDSGEGNATRGVFDGGFRNCGALAQHDLHFGPNMTPMVDVVMVILIFFMAATAFVGPEWLVRAGLASDEPPAVAAEDGQTADDVDLAALLPNPPIEITLSWDGQQTRASGLGIEAVRVDVMAAALAREGPVLTAGGDASMPTVLLAAEDAVPYQDVVRLHDACVAAGLSRVLLR